MAAPGAVPLPGPLTQAAPPSASPVTVVHRRLDALNARWSRTRPGRVWTRYGRAGGGTLAAGAAYFAFFSLVPALAIGFTVLGLVLGGREDLQADVVRYLNDNLGTTLVSLRGGQGALVALDEITGAGAVGTAGLFGAIGLLLTGLGWAGSMRQGIRSVFGIRGGTNVVVDRLRDVLLMAVLGLAVLVSVALSLSVTTLAGVVERWLDLDQVALGSRVLQLGATALVVGVDAVALAVFFRMMAGTSPRWRDLVQAAVLGACALSLLKLFGGLLLGRTTSSRFLTAFAVVVGLLIWMNIAARIVLLAAAWAADRSQRGVLPPALLAPGEWAASPARPGDALLPVPTRPAGSPPSAADVPGADAVSVAAGVVLGAVATYALTGLRGVGSGTRRARHRWRRRG